jgi:hypothetical protein
LCHWGQWRRGVKNAHWREFGVPHWWGFGVPLWRARSSHCLPESYRRGGAGFFSHYGDGLAWVPICGGWGAPLVGVWGSDWRGFRLAQIPPLVGLFEPVPPTFSP